MSGFSCIPNYSFKEDDPEGYERLYTCIDMAIKRLEEPPFFQGHDIYVLPPGERGEAIQAQLKALLKEMPQQGDLE